MFSIKREIRHFHVVVVQKGQRIVLKCDARGKLLFCLLNLFFLVHVAVASFDLKVPIESTYHWVYQELVHCNEVSNTMLTIHSLFTPGGGLARMRGGPRQIQDSQRGSHQ